MANILISGYYGFDNAGDDSVLHGIINSLKKNDPSLTFTVLSNQPGKTEKMFGVSAYNRWNISEVIGQIKKHDLLVMGGGSLLQDATSPRSVFYYLGIVLVAKLYKKPVVFYGQGFGPVTKPISKMLIKRIVNKVDVITVRDFKSREDLQKIGVNKSPIVITADPAVTIYPESIDMNVGRQLLIDLNLAPEKTIVISVRPWKKEQHYKKVLTEVSDHFGSKGWNILFLPMQYPADVAPAKDIMAMMKEKAYVIDRPLDFKEIISLIGNTRLVLGMRLHSIILAAVMNIPFVGISYDQKVDRFVEMVDMHSAGHIRDLETKNVIESVEKTISNEQQIKARLANNMKDIIAKAEQNSQLTLEKLK
ncbi:polysaccharide pyruvyl transferase CsaB [Evansella sp. AB-rgal1]|uniref:polysaccharide pyruvyl transferase CsaB n=1 Tax=Evansella sp. AB-rgal1 TaxID=3242696 RepID=UPI00359CCA10